MRINILKKINGKTEIITTIRLFSADMAGEVATNYIAQAKDDAMFWDWAK